MRMKWKQIFGFFNGVSSFKGSQVEVDTAVTSAPVSTLNAIGFPCTSIMI